MGISTKKHRKTFNEINITPLTDIFLVLLIIMMVIAPLLDQQGLNLIVPNEQQTEKPNESKLITVDVDANGSYSLDGKNVSSEELLFSIQNAAKEKKDGLLIQADGNSMHQAVVTAMDSARNAGVSNISVIEK